MSPGQWCVVGLIAYGALFAPALALIVGRRLARLSGTYPTPELARRRAQLAAAQLLHQRLHPVGADTTCPRCRVVGAELADMIMSVPPKERGSMTYVRTHTGEKIVCCWDDCQRPGHDEIKVQLQHENKEWWNYLFCTERHKQMFVNSHREYARLPVGARGGIL